ncbi:MAG: YlxM family DNA-binding protein [Lachnospiraceae bacterium]|nr:YlxM family DNA-binding protein [Lachnospiraceae bacterium]
MEKIVELGLLYDFYGELLTEHQRRIYEDAVFQDMSLAEIAEEAGISRQGVHDLLRRCDKLLLGYESKLHLAERFMEAKKTVKEILRLAEEASESGGGGQTEQLKEIQKLSNRLLEEL